MTPAVAHRHTSANILPHGRLARGLRRVLPTLGVLLSCITMGACDDGFRPGWFEEDWHTDYRLDLIQPLANYGFDCDNFRYRRSTKWRDSYQVQCSPDGSEWTSFLVWPRDGRVRRQ